jgi:transposase
MGRPSKYPAELRERAVRMVFEHAHEHPSQWATIRSVASKLDCTTECLRRWVRQAERDTGRRPGLTTSERERLKELEREDPPPEPLDSRTVNHGMSRRYLINGHSRPVVPDGHGPDRSAVGDYRTLVQGEAAA